MLSTDKLKNKEVINIFFFFFMRFVSDIEVVLEVGVMGGIVIPRERGFLNWFGRGENDILIKWEKVKTVGDDVILVDLGPQDVV